MLLDLYQDWKKNMSKAKELFRKLDKAIEECIEIPNTHLPEKYHNNTTGYVTIGKLNKQCDKRDKITESQKLKAEKLRRIGLYREQMQSNDKIEYVDINEHRLYNNQMNFAKYCPQINLEEK